MNNEKKTVLDRKFGNYTKKHLKKSFVYYMIFGN